MSAKDKKTQAYFDKTLSEHKTFRSGLLRSRINPQSIGVKSVTRQLDF